MPIRTVTTISLMLALGPLVGGQQTPSGDASMGVVLHPIAPAGTYGGPGKDLTITLRQNGLVESIIATARPQAGLPFTLTATSKILTIGTDCASFVFSNTPCKVSFRDQTYGITQSATLTLSSGSGPAFVYGDRQGRIGVTTGLIAACDSGCQTQPGTQFPPDVVPLYRCDASAGSWVLPCQDWRAVYRREPNDPGFGVAIQKVGAANVLNIDRVGLRYGENFTNVDTVLVPFSRHGIGSVDILFVCHTNTNPAEVITPYRFFVDPTTYDVTIKFDSPKSGRCSLL